MSFSSEECFSDRRRHARHGLHGRVKIGDYCGKLVDMSISGMQVILIGEPEVGRTYPCQVSIDDSRGLSEIEMTAFVRHSQRYSNLGEYRIGLEFDTISDEMHWLLMDSLSTLTTATV